MVITDRIWDAYIKGLRKINNKAAEEMLSYLNTHSWDADYAARQAAIDYAYALSTKYGEAASSLACEMYDAVAAASGANVPAAIPAATATIGDVAKAVNGTGKYGNYEMMAGAVGRLVKMAAADTALNNAIRDRAEYAWIPRGDTCAFCITLASNGWQPASAEALKGGHAEHIHANCDCMYAIRMNSSTNVAGYDPDKYLQMYYDADTSSRGWGSSNNDRDVEKPHYQNLSTARINGMRREFYKENAEKIRMQKRSAYEKRKELESSKAEETDIT